MNDPSEQILESQIVLLDAHLGDSPLDLCIRARLPRFSLACVHCTCDVESEQRALATRSCTCPGVPYSLIAFSLNLSVQACGLLNWSGGKACLNNLAKRCVPGCASP